tara:strand:- start:15 stop:2102 length:2088 start_codon:yes stop_codon:yes gene_type:complete
MARAKREPKKNPKAESAETYVNRLNWQTEANQKSRLAHRDFGPIPKPKNGRRRGGCRRNLKRFCEVYLGATFDMAWSPDHLLVIKKLEAAVIKGGLFALAMPRGSGKTSLTEAAALWAILYAHRRFVFLVGATEPLAGNLLQSIKVELEANDLLLEDFPEACLPIRKLERIVTRRLNSEGNSVLMKLGAGELNLPWILNGKNAASAGGVVQVCGITGAIRGAKSKLPNGQTIRPDFVIMDDPQTDESAHSPKQVKLREDTIAGAILGLAGPGKKIAAVMPVTVIADGCLADLYLDRDLHPEWNGIRIPFVKEFPERLELWDAYKEKRADSMRKHGDGRDSTEYYRENRSAMDEGAVVSWASRFDPDELSAVQHAMNKKFANEKAFWSEFQNEPRESTDVDLRLMSVAEIAGKTNSLKHLEVMSGVKFVTGFIDVQANCLYYALVGWRADFTGSIIDYGTFPDQRRGYYQLSDINRTLIKEFPKAAREGSITAGLGALVEFLNGREYIREGDAVSMAPNLLLIDANWQTETIRDFCRRLRSPAVVPAHGRYVGAASRPVQEYHQKAGELVGTYWKSSTISAVDHILFDTNYWKSFVHDRLSIELGDEGSLTFFGKNKDTHRMIAEHLTAEYRIRVTSSVGRTVDEWKDKANQPDNHLLDCVAGAAVAGGVMGCQLSRDITGDVRVAAPKKKRNFNL